MSYLDYLYLSGVEDYTEMNVTLTFRNETENCLTITIQTDLVAETNETFFVELSSNDPAISFVASSAEVIIEDATGSLSQMNHDHLWARKKRK